MDDALRAIADPTRRRILELVAVHERTAGDIASHFEVSRPAISQHLAVLRDAGLVDERRDGTRRWYRARPEGLQPVRQYLDQFWTDQLRRLRDAVERGASS